MRGLYLQFGTAFRGHGTCFTRRLVSVLCAAALLLLSLTGCAQTAEKETGTEEISTPVGTDLFAPREEEPLPLPERFALPYEAEHTLDPITCPDGMQQVVGSLLYEGLFRLNGSLEPELCLCESCGPDASFRFWTFNLRPGVTFSDGSPLSAYAVKAVLDRARESVRYGSRLRNVAEISAAGETLYITLTAPNAGLPALLDIPICKETEGVPLGTGPYYFSKEDGGAWLLANPAWWQGGGQPTDRIFLEESQDAMLYRFTSGDVHLIVSNLIGGDPAAITGDIAYTDATSLRFHFLSCNAARPLMSDASLRRALNRGVNRKGLVQDLLSGHALAAQFPVSPASPLYPKGLEEAYSSSALPAAAAEMGYNPDRPLILLVNSENAFKVSVARSIAETYTADGIPTEVRVLPWEEYQAAIAAGDWDLCYGEAVLTADWNLSNLLGAEGALNPGGWSDWRCTQLLYTFSYTKDRAAAMGELCTYLRENVPLIPLCFGNTSVLTRAGVVENLSPTAAEPFYNLTACAIHLKEPEA